MVKEAEKTQAHLCSSVCRTEDGRTYTGYGIAVYKEPAHERIFFAEDLSEDRRAVEELIRMIGEQDVSAVHIEDVVEDFLT